MGKCQLHAPTTGTLILIAMGSPFSAGCSLPPAARSEAPPRRKRAQRGHRLNVLRREAAMPHARHRFSLRDVALTPRDRAIATSPFPS